MRVIFAAALLSSAVSASAAGGAWDGIYTCTITANGTRFGSYVAINGQPDGRAVFSIPATSSAASFWGYGIGRIDGAIFSGLTDQGRPFRLEADARGFAGWIEALQQNVIFTVTGRCDKIW